MNGLMETLDFAFLAEAVPAAEAGLSALDVVGMILATIGLVFFLGAAVGRPWGVLSVTLTPSVRRGHPRDATEPKMLPT